MKKLYVSDFTLAKLSGERKNPLIFREKTAIAASIDAMGVDAIELAPVGKVKEDTIIYKTISANVKNAALCLPVGFSTEDVDIAWECISGAVKPCLQVVLPVSTVQMEYTYHVKAEKMLAKAETLFKAAKEKCGLVEFVAVDATRADEAFLKAICKKAEECGVSAVTIGDEAGILLPDEFAALVKTIKGEISIPFYVHVSDNLNMATATAITAAVAGADGVKSVVVGKNELLADKFAAAVNAKGETLGITTGLEITKLHSDINLLTKKVNSTDAGKPSDGIKLGNDVFLDGDSTIEQVAKAAADLGYALSDEDNGKVFRGLSRVLEKKGSVGTKEFEAVIATYAMQAPTAYLLDNYTTTSSNVTASVARVALLKDDKMLVGVSSGSGPVDAAFSAIEQSIGFHYELDDFQIITVTQGKDSLGSALVKLRSNGKLYSGRGISTDIVGASIRAYINALNKIVYEEE